MENTLRLFPDNLTVKDEIPPGTPEDAYIYKRDSIEINLNKVSLNPVFEEINDDDMEIAKKYCPKIKSISMEFESRVSPKVLQI